MQQQNAGSLGFAIRYGLFSFGPMFFMISVLVDETFGTQSFGSNPYARAIMAMAIGFCWGLAMHRILPRLGLRTR